MVTDWLDKEALSGMIEIKAGRLCGWGTKETRGKALLVNSWIKRRTVLHSHPQLSESLKCEPLCSHENSIKSCESRKSEFPPM